MSNSTSAISHWILSTDSRTEDCVQVTLSPTERAKRTNRNVENAIYAHIRAIRALGRETINTIDIAEALSLPVSAVNRAISALEKKGVKVLDA
jgi:hypothetical protein